jgi:hypothetical protein
MIAEKRKFTYFKYSMANELPTPTKYLRNEHNLLYVIQKLKTFVKLTITKYS